MLKQAINLPGVANARELGGYAVGDKRVKQGILLRSADLGRATPEAIERLHDVYHTQVVVDFRMGIEQEKRPDPQVAGATNRRLSIIEMEDFPVPEGIDPSKLALFNDPTANRMQLFEITYEYGMVGPELYVNFLTRERGKQGFAAFFRELLELSEGRAILWHCTDGKDRTGCAAMLLLSALGASRRMALDDFLLTNDYNARAVEAAMRQFAAYPMPKEKLEALRVMVGGVAESYMAHTIDVLEERYGSVEGYLRDELGVGTRELNLLRNKFLV
ncbi:MAG: tyrosine-protein phosphatase [Atopobiaceae bacterium]|nr:tyrosine-protein phosphatase [Atopobiaceae bacterium]